jgi:hypothetical protein
MTVFKDQEVVTYSIWSIARKSAEQGYLTKHIEFSNSVYQELFTKCLEQGMDFSLILNILFSIDSELIKEEPIISQGVQDKGVLSESKDK